MRGAPLALVDVTEKEWQAQLVSLARTLGFKHVYHTHDSRKSASGFPDLVLIRERVVFIECKREKGKLTETQAAWILALNAAGAEVYVARPRDLDNLAVLLAHRGRPQDVYANSDSGSRVWEAWLALATHAYDEVEKVLA